MTGALGLVRRQPLVEQLVAELQLLRGGADGEPVEDLALARAAGGEVAGTRRERAPRHGDQVGRAVGRGDPPDGVREDVAADRGAAAVGVVRAGLRGAAEHGERAARRRARRRVDHPLLLRVHLAAPLRLRLGERPADQLLDVHGRRGRGRRLLVASARRPRDQHERRDDRGGGERDAEPPHGEGGAAAGAPARGLDQRALELWDVGHVSSFAARSRASPRLTRLRTTCSEQRRPAAISG